VQVRLGFLFRCVFSLMEIAKNKNKSQ